MRLISCVIISFLTFCVLSQNKINVAYKIDGFQQLIKHPQDQFKDSTTINEYLIDIQSLSYKKGYVLFSINKNWTDSTQLTIEGNLGPKFNSITLTLKDPQQLNFLKKHMRINEKFLLNLPISPSVFDNEIKRMLKSYNDNGYPFASIQINQVEITEQKIRGTLQINPGQRVRWNKIHVKGDSSVAKSYVLSLIDFKEGDLFSLEKLSRSRNQIELNPFLSETIPAEWIFTNDGAELFLYLEANPVSSVNGIIGLQQNPSGKLTLTGDANVKLINALKRGESIHFRWQSIREGTQALKADLIFPYLFKTSFGIDGQFQLYKRDTSFLDIKFKSGIRYNFDQNQALKLSYIRNNLELLSGATLNTEFTNLSAVVFDGYSLEYDLIRLDYLPNPSKGYTINAEVIGGVRKFKPSDSTYFTTASTYSMHSKFDIYIPLFKRNVLHFSNISSTLNSQNIYQNELFRFGGQQVQRGFNQDEIFASFFTTTTIEYRFLIDKNSHVLAFYDQSWYENNSGQYFNDHPFGFGIGFTFGTKIGMFNMTYALGKQFDNPILLSNGKIHFGYIAYF